jgi:hypothetical protein
MKQNLIEIEIQKTEPMATELLAPEPLKQSNPNLTIT